MTACRAMETITHGDVAVALRGALRCTHTRSPGIARHAHARDVGEPLRGITTWSWRPFAPRSSVMAARGESVVLGD